MGFDIEALRAAVAAHGRVSRVVIAEVRGSSPREPGASMLIWDGGQSGTIGGGALEFAATEAALAGSLGISRHALGPDLGQCCGGSVTLVTESFDADDLARLGDGPVIVRGIGQDEMPLAVHRLVSRSRDRGDLPDPQLIDRWMVEPVTMRQQPVWIWGAGHVGRALVDVMAPLPDLALTWADTGPERFPDDVAPGVTVVPAARMAALMPHAPKEAAHLILTYSHALDLDLCNAALAHEFRFAGLIGSATKWARFRSRLTDLGHSPSDIARITCPIGNPSLGKHPHAIAIGVAASLLSRTDAASRQSVHA